MKRIVALLLGLILTASLAGCQGDDYDVTESLLEESSAVSEAAESTESMPEESGASSQNQSRAASEVKTSSTFRKPGLVSNKKVTLTYYVWGNANEFKLIERIVNDFQKEYPNIKINIERSASDYFQNFIIRVGANNAPDVFFMDVSEYAVFAKKGLLKELDSYLPKAGFTEKDLWDINSMYRFDGKTVGKGKLYALIKDWSPNYMLFYNKDHYAAAGIPEPDPEKPMSWDEFMNVAKKLTMKDSSGKINRYGTIMDYDAMKHFQEFVVMCGGSVYSSDFKKATLTTPQVKKAAEYFVALQKGDDAPARYSTETMSLNGGDMFAAGTVSNVFYGLWGVPAYFESARNLNFGVALPPVPAGSSVKGSMAAGIISHSIYGKTKNPDEAFLFLNFLQTKGQIRLAEAGFNIPGNKTVAYNEFLNVSDPKRREMHAFFIKCAENYVIKPVANPYISQLKFEQIVSPKLVAVILGRQTLDQALKQAEDELNAELKANIR